MNSSYIIEKQFYDYCPIRWCIYHSNSFLSNQNLWDNNENSTHYKMSLIVKNSNISNRTVSLTELKNLFNEVIEIEWIKEYDTVYDYYIYYRNQIIDVLKNNINPSILDRVVYKYNNILVKYLK
jgi:hypothetical protein